MVEAVVFRILYYFGTLTHALLLLLIKAFFQIWEAAAIIKIDSFLDDDQ